MPIMQENIEASGVTILRPIGRVDSANAPEMEKMLKGALDAGATKIVFELTQLDYISSAGLRVILMAAKKLGKGVGRVILVGMQAEVENVFVMSGFLAMFPNGRAQTLDEGLKLF